MATDRREARARPRGGGRAYPQTQVGENLCKFRRTSSPSVRPRMHLCAAKETRGDRDSDLTRVSPGWGECWAAPHVCEGRSRLPRCRGRDRPAGCTDCLVHRAACCAALACMSLSRFRVSLAFLVKSSESKLRPELWRIFEKSIDVVRSRRRVPASRALRGGGPHVGPLTSVWRWLCLLRRGSRRRSAWARRHMQRWPSRMPPRRVTTASSLQNRSSGMVSAAQGTYIDRKQLCNLQACVTDMFGNRSKSAHQNSKPSSEIIHTPFRQGTHRPARAARRRSDRPALTCLRSRICLFAVVGHCSHIW